MSATVAVLLFSAALAHAGWNLAAKRIGTGGACTVWLYQTLSAALVLPVAITVLVVTDVQPRWSWLPAIVVSGALHATYSVVLFRGYATGDLSVVYPTARGSGPLLSVAAAVLVLGERPGWIGLLGAVVVVVGVLIIALGPGDRRGARPTSFGYGLLAGVTMAARTLWDAYAMRTLTVPALLYFAARSVTHSLLLTPYALSRRHQISALWREHRRDILVVAAVAPVASVLVLYAMRLAPVSVVAPARELSVVIGAVVAWRWLGEPDPVRRLVGAAVVLVGVVAIALAGQP